ncbi:unnamed protein product [Linum tenue]|uniref:Uncharacterized protein n=1 Tax=Linum tenue TaxID=586396 RepID=A0AAV0LPV1_9ROSI|nr:unnamed protein product [Linum tenue]
MGIGVAEIRGLGELRALETMAISFMDLNNLNGLENLRFLATLILSECPSLANLDGLQLLGALEELNLNGASFGRKPSLDLSGLVNLKRLNIRLCQGLKEVTGLERLVTLERLVMESCTSIRQLPDLSELSNLKYLNLSGCAGLIHLIGVDRLVSLRQLLLSWCCSIAKLPNLSGPKNLERLYIVGCTKLIEVNGLDELKELQDLEMGKRMRMKYLVKSAARYGKGLASSLLLGLSPTASGTSSS